MSKTITCVTCGTSFVGPGAAHEFASHADAHYRRAALAAADRIAFELRLDEPARPDLRLVSSPEAPPTTSGSGAAAQPSRESRHPASPDASGRPATQSHKESL